VVIGSSLVLFPPQAPRAAACQRDASDSSVALRGGQYTSNAMRIAVGYTEDYLVEEDVRFANTFCRTSNVEKLTKARSNLMNRSREKNVLKKLHHE